jgi:hypothetical protein
VNNLYSKASDAQYKLTQAVTKFVKDFFPFLILLLNIAVMIGSSLFNAWLDNPFTIDFWKSLGTNLMTTMVAYICFIKYGEVNERQNLENYEINHKSWTLLAETVRNRYPNEFNEYCQQQVILEREEKKHLIISNNTMIPIETYDDTYKKCSEKDLKTMVEDGKISEEDAAWILKANKCNKINPISPLFILGGVKGKTINDTVRETKLSDSTKNVILRPFVVFILSTVTAMLKGTWVGFGDASAVFDMIYSTFSLVLSSYMGYSSGANNAKRELERIKGRILFIERFINSREEKKLLS